MAENEKALDDIRAAMRKALLSPQHKAALRRAGYELVIGRVIPVTSKIEVE